MKLDDLRIYDTRCIVPLYGDYKVGIVADTTINDKFECISLHTKTNEFIFSLVDDEIDDQEIPKDVLEEANNIINNIGGLDKIIDIIQWIYDMAIEREKSFGDDDHFYENLGKDNIRSYITKTSII